MGRLRLPRWQPEQAGQASVQQLSHQFRVWLCDIWGVVHDGHHAIASAVEALVKHRQSGGKVVLITNAPRPKFNVLAQLEAIGVTPAVFDDIVSSGDVTRSLMEAHGDLFHIGPQSDLSLFEKSTARRVGIDKAKAVVCTGYFEDRSTDDEAYLPEFEAMLARKLMMICANPDRVVRIGKHLVLCAGTLADAYAAMGGEVLMAGKPFAPIYDLALQKAGNPPRAQVMVIGDGPETDVKGAALQGFPCYFVSGGINSAPDVVDKVKRDIPAARIVGSSAELHWA